MTDVTVKLESLIEKGGSFLRIEFQNLF